MRTEDSTIPCRDGCPIPLRIRPRRPRLLRTRIELILPPSWILPSAA